MSAHDCRIAVFGASGLIGRAIVNDLRRRGFAVIGVARRFAPGQPTGDDRTLPILSLDADTLASHLRDWKVDVVVNCLGVLQDGPGSDTRAVHTGFVGRLLQALRQSGRAIRLVQISIPGDSAGDVTAFSRTKRDAEGLIAASGLDYAILRPGFVIAPAAYGGSALLRALAALPFALPTKDANVPFQPVAVADIGATVAWLCARTMPWGGVVWDLMQPRRVTLGGVVDEFRRWLGTRDQLRVSAPAWLVDFGAKLGDLAAWLGWMPPMRSTAIAELRRGVTGDPSAWMVATAIAPVELADAVGRAGATIQDKWFARLYPVKAVMIAALCVFWIVSGFIALAISYPAANAILLSHHFSPVLAGPFTVISSLVDMSVGALIAVERTCRYGLIAGIVVSLGYMFGAAVLTPDLWIEPLGALVKTFPAIVLMLATLLILDNR